MGTARRKDAKFYLAYMRAALIFSAVLLALDWAMFATTGYWVPWQLVIALGAVWPAVMLLIT